MKPTLLFLLLIIGISVAAAQTTIDRVVAVVNKRVITQSEWDEQERFEALVNGRRPESVEFTPASLDRLVDQQLMREQIEYVRFDSPTPEQKAAQVAAIRKQVAPTLDDAQWEAMLAKYSLSAEEFERLVADQVEVMRFVDMRFRPSVHVETEQIESYYKDSFVPQMVKAGTLKESVPQLKEVETKIRGILAEEKLNEMLRTWLTSLRSQGRVKRLVAGAKAASSTGAN